MFMLTRTLSNVRRGVPEDMNRKDTAYQRVGLPPAGRKRNGAGRGPHRSPLFVYCFIFNRRVGMWVLVSLFSMSSGNRHILKLQKITCSLTTEITNRKYFFCDSYRSY